jgi:hypothetical protein
MKKVFSKVQCLLTFNIGQKKTNNKEFQIKALINIIEAETVFTMKTLKPPKKFL